MPVTGSLILGGAGLAGSGLGFLGSSQSGKAGQKAQRNAVNAALLGHQIIGQRFDPILNDLQGALGPLQEALSGRAGPNVAAGLDASQSLLGAIPGLLKPGEPLPFGINAPGVLDSLIARSQESVSREAQTAGRSAAQFLPTRGGAAARSVSDIFARAAGEGASLETGLRTEAANRALSDRLSMLGGISGALGPVSGSTLTGIEATLSPLQFRSQLANAIASLQTGIQTAFMGGSFNAAQNAFNRAGASGAAAGQGLGGTLGNILALNMMGGGGSGKSGAGNGPGALAGALTGASLGAP